jgi:hypothetical protein
LQELLQHSIEKEQPPPVGEHLLPPDEPPDELPPDEEPPLEDPPLDDPPLEDPPLEELPNVGPSSPSPLGLGCEVSLLPEVPVSSSSPHAKASEAERITEARTIFEAFMPRRRSLRGVVAKNPEKMIS